MVGRANYLYIMRNVQDFLSQLFWETERAPLALYCLAQMSTDIIVALSYELFIIETDFEDISTAREWLKGFAEGNGWKAVKACNDEDAMHYLIRGVLYHFCLADPREITVMREILARKIEPEEIQCQGK